MDLTIRDMKIITNQIIAEEARKGKINPNENVIFRPLTFVELYGGSRSLIKKNVLQKSSEYLFWRISEGFYNPNTNELVVFLDKIKEIKKVEKRLFYLLHVCFHEIQHRYQFQYDSLSSSGFLIDIESYLMENRYDYYLNHDNYFTEADANYSGVIKAKKYMIDYYPEEYEKEKYDIDLLEWRYLLDLKMYDISKSFDSIVKYIKKNKKRFNNLKIISSVLPIFLNNDGSFKTLDEIFYNSMLYKIDREIVYAVFASNSFWKTFNCNDIPSEYISVILESLKYHYNVYAEQINCLEEVETQKRAEYRQKIMNENNQISNFIETSLYMFEKFGRFNSKKNEKKEFLKNIEEKIKKLESMEKGISFS